MLSIRSKELIAEMLEGLNSYSPKIYKPHKLGQVMPGPTKKGAGKKITVVKQHQSHSKKGTEFTVRQHLRTLNGTGEYNNPVFDPNYRGASGVYGIKVPNFNPSSIVSKNTMWVRAKDKAAANEIARKYLEQR